MRAGCTSSRGIPVAPPRPAAAQRRVRAAGRRPAVILAQWNRRSVCCQSFDAQGAPTRADRCHGGSAMARVNNAVLLNEHPVDQALLRYFLSSRGVASSSLSPRAGLEALAAMAPDLVIADAAGDHSCTRLRERLPAARIVAVAEAPGTVDGADAVLHRPLDFQ